LKIVGKDLGKISSLSFPPPSNFTADTQDGTGERLASLYYDFRAELPEELRLELESPEDQTVTEHLFVNVVHSLLLNNTPAKLKIYLQLSRDFTADQFVTRQLHNFFGNESITLVQKYQEANLIISDTYESAQDHQHFFHFNNIYSIIEWEELTHIIGSMLVKQNYQLVYGSFETS
ncbi:MAG: hypothetical protein LBM27_01590, partial [Lactobacillaceae bacterium]|jgi:hypothetical protein|nr:hypothetical protein [Lactobacillaceae bacterium]